MNPFHAFISLAFAALLVGCTTPDYATPSADDPVELPRDHAAHAEHKLEWWYFNGHFQGHDETPYSFFVSFVRYNSRGDRIFGLPIVTVRPQTHVAMFALLNRETGEFVSHARANYPDWWAARADLERPWVRHDSWGLQWHDGTFYILVHFDDASLHLEMTPTRDAVLYGDNGFVDVAVAPHYMFSYTRMDVTGALIDGKESWRIDGRGWHDHMFGNIRTSKVRDWDWMSLQLDDGTDYMIGRMRMGDDLVPYPHFRVDPDGEVHPISDSELRMTNTQTWSSPRGNNYRLYWEISGPGFEFDIEPIHEDQEFWSAPIPPIWEGAVRVTGTRNGKPVEGLGYLKTIERGGLPLKGLRPAY